MFWLGTTQWQLFRGYKLEDAKTILEKTAEPRALPSSRSCSWASATARRPTSTGEKPWIDDDPLTPNEAYFKNVDAVLRIARDNNLSISMTLYHQRYRKHITVENARPWAKWLAQRYKDAPNIVWSMTPEAQAGVRAGPAGVGGRAARRRRRPPPRDVQARSRALLVQLHPRRALAGFRLDADLEQRRS